MGTRADFYVGRGQDAEWLGSVAWDGYPSGFPTALMLHSDERTWRQAVKNILTEREDGTLPEQGWPWPWETSHTTDYAYALDGGKVYGSCFGNEWWPASDEPSDYDEEKDEEIPRADLPADAFPDMTDRKVPTLGKRSGVIVIQG